MLKAPEILEAVEFLVSRGSVSALHESAVRRGGLDDDMGYGADVSHVFYGRERRRRRDSICRLRTAQQRLAGTILSLAEVGETADRPRRNRTPTSVTDGAGRAGGSSC